jgi:rRNA maturation endonuclease Nob1
MKYISKCILDCSECGQEYKIFYKSKEMPEFCPFCGETITQDLTAIKLEFDEEDDEEEFEW